MHQLLSASDYGVRLCHATAARFGLLKGRLVLLDYSARLALHAFTTGAARRSHANTARGGCENPATFLLKLDLKGLCTLGSLLRVLVNRSDLLGRPAEERVHVAQLARLLRVFEGEAHTGLHVRHFLLKRGELLLNLGEHLRLLFDLALNFGEDTAVITFRRGPRRNKDRIVGARRRACVCRPA